MSEFEHELRRTKQDRHENNYSLERFERTMYSLEMEGGDGADRRYIHLLNEIDTLISRAEVFNPHILSQVFAERYDEDELEFEQWQERLALVPARLLARNIPDFTSIDTEYIDRIFRIALPDSSPHDYSCISFNQSQTSCTLSISCPARCMLDISHTILDFAGIQMAIGRVSDNFSASRLQNIALQMRRIEQHMLDRGLDTPDAIASDSIRRDTDIESFLERLLDSET